MVYCGLLWFLLWFTMVFYGSLSYGKSPGNGIDIMVEEFLKPVSNRFIGFLNHPGFKTVVRGQLEETGDIWRHEKTTLND